MCGPVFKRVAESIMAKNVQSDFSSAIDTVNSHLPLVKAGDLAATRQALHTMNIQHQADFDETTSETVWGNTNHTSSNIMLTEIADTAKAVPEVIGYGLRDAIYRLECLGLKVKVYGTGTVSKQSLKPGSAYKAGDEIELTLKE